MPRCSSMMMKSCHDIRQMRCNRYSFLRFPVLSFLFRSLCAKANLTSCLRKYSIASSIPVDLRSQGQLTLIFHEHQRPFYAPPPSVLRGRASVFRFTNPTQIRTFTMNSKNLRSQRMLVRNSGYIRNNHWFTGRKNTGYASYVKSFQITANFTIY